MYLQSHVPGTAAWSSRSSTGNVTLTGPEAPSRRRQRPQQVQLGLQGDPLLVNHLKLLLKLAVEACQHRVGLLVLADRHLDLPLLTGRQFLRRLGVRWKHGGWRCRLQVLRLGVVFPADRLLRSLTMRQSNQILFRSACQVFCTWSESGTWTLFFNFDPVLLLFSKVTEVSKVWLLHLILRSFL